MNGLRFDVSVSERIIRNFIDSEFFGFGFLREAPGLYGGETCLLSFLLGFDPGLFLLSLFSSTLLLLQTSSLELTLLAFPFFKGQLQLLILFTEFLSIGLSLLLSLLIGILLRIFCGLFSFNTLALSLCLFGSKSLPLRLLSFRLEPSGLLLHFDSKAFLLLSLLGGFVLSFFRNLLHFKSGLIFDTLFLENRVSGLFLVERNRLYRHIAIMALLTLDDFLGLLMNWLLGLRYYFLPYLLLICLICCRKIRCGIVAQLFQLLLLTTQGLRLCLKYFKLLF